MNIYQGGQLILQGKKPPDDDEEFNRLMRAVASGKISADEAWRILKEQKDNVPADSR